MLYVWIKHTGDFEKALVGARVMLQKLKVTYESNIDNLLFEYFIWSE